MKHSTGADGVHSASSLSVCLSPTHSPPSGLPCHLGSYSNCLRVLSLSSLSPTSSHTLGSSHSKLLPVPPDTFYPFSSLCLRFPESSTRPPTLQPPLSDKYPALKMLPTFKLQWHVPELTWDPFLQTPTALFVHTWTSLLFRLILKQHSIASKSIKLYYVTLGKRLNLSVLIS